MKANILDWIGAITIISLAALCAFFGAVLLILRVTWPFAAIVAGVYVALVLADKI